MVGDPMVPGELSAASAGFRDCCPGPLSVSEFVPGRAVLEVLDALISAASSGIDHAPGAPLEGVAADEASWPTAGLAVCGGVVRASSPDAAEGFCCAVEAGAVSRGGTAGGFAPVFGRDCSATEATECVGSAAVG
ncbi:hypothetical protein [Nocardia neocaledoniensis]|uniref:hypothetical protein n=1 Tax=Nocardia neocaledoniensis TaxID=236511 RepID=UPI002453C3FB|nr:hypothetical protein [Nocardia neocaledoniensis]